MTGYPTSIGTSDETSIQLLGQDLAADLMGQVGFGELAFWLVAMRRPTAGELRVFEAVLVALADHGLTPTVIAARLTLTGAPESVQGAMAAGLLGGGSRFLGVTEDAGRFLADALAAAAPTAASCRPTDAGWDELARERRAASCATAGGYVPGLGHPVHKDGDPRTPVLIADRRRGGPARAAPAAVRGGRAGAPRGARPHAAAQRRRRLRRRAVRPRLPGRHPARRSRCWPARPACSATSPRRCAARSAARSTSGRPGGRLRASGRGLTRRATTGHVVAGALRARAAPVGGVRTRDARTRASRVAWSGRDNGGSCARRTTSCAFGRRRPLVTNSGSACLSARSSTTIGRGSAPGCRRPRGERP